jgi:excisionase family DNA binding protein
MNSLPKLMTIKEFAEWFHIKNKTVYDWIYQHKINAVRIGHTVRVVVNEKELNSMTK